MQGGSRSSHRNYRHLTCSCSVFTRVSTTLIKEFYNAIPQILLTELRLRCIEKLEENLLLHYLASNEVPLLLSQSLYS